MEPDQSPAQIPAGFRFLNGPKPADQLDNGEVIGPEAGGLMTVWTPQEGVLIMEVPVDHAGAYRLPAFYELTTQAGHDLARDLLALLDQLDPTAEPLGPSGVEALRRERNAHRNADRAAREAEASAAYWRGRTLDAEAALWRAQQLDHAAELAHWQARALDAEAALNRTTTTTEDTDR